MRTAKSRASCVAATISATGASKCLHLRGKTVFCKDHERLILAGESVRIYVSGEIASLSGAVAESGEPSLSRPQDGLSDRLEGPTSQRRNKPRAGGRVRADRSAQGQVSVGPSLPESRPLLSVSIDLDPRGANPNAREHHYVRARRFASERTRTLGALQGAERSGWARDLRVAIGSAPWSGVRLIVGLTRVTTWRPQLDDDNCIARFKSVRDSVAEWVGVDDGDPGYSWICRQEKGDSNGVRIEFWEATKCSVNT